MNPDINPNLETSNLSTAGSESTVCTDEDAWVPEEQEKWNKSHGEDNLTALEERLCDMPQDDGSKVGMIERERRKILHKRMVILSSFPNLDEDDIDFFYSGEIRARGFYADTDTHPVMAQGESCFDAAPKVPILCDMIEEHWKDEFCKIIITVFRTPTLLPLLAALR